MAFLDKFDLAFRPELRLLAIFVSLLACNVGFLANRGVLYHIFAENQEKSKIMSVTWHCVSISYPFDCTQGRLLPDPFDFQAVSQLHHRTIILFAISAKLQKLFVNRYNQAFFTNSWQNIGYFFMVLRLLCCLSTAKPGNQAPNANNTNHSGNVKTTRQDRHFGFDTGRASQ